MLRELCQGSEQILARGCEGGLGFRLLALRLHGLGSKELRLASGVDKHGDEPCKLLADG